MNTYRLIKICGNKFKFQKASRIYIIYSVILYILINTLGCVNGKNNRLNDNGNNQTSTSHIHDYSYKNIRTVNLININLLEFPNLRRMMTNIRNQLDTLCAYPESPMYFFAKIKKDSISNEYFDIKINPITYNPCSNIYNMEIFNDSIPDINCITYFDSIPILISADDNFLNVSKNTKYVQSDSIKLRFYKYNELEPATVDGCLPLWNCKFNKKSLKWIRLYNGFIWLRYIPRKEFQRKSKEINDSLKKHLERYITEHGDTPIWKDISAKDYITIMPDD